MLSQLLNVIDSYLLSRCTLRGLETWLLSSLQRILDSGEATAVDLANDVDADLVELGEGIIDETTFREHLQSYLRIRESISVEYYETKPQIDILATNSADMIKGEMVINGPVVDLHLQHSFV